LCRTYGACGIWVWTQRLYAGLNSAAPLALVGCVVAGCGEWRKMIFINEDLLAALWSGFFVLEAVKN
jgi:hypothetical protein